MTRCKQDFFRISDEPARYKECSSLYVQIFFRALQMFYLYLELAFPSYLYDDALTENSIASN